MSLVLLVFNIFAVCGQSSTRTVLGEVVYAEDGTPVAGASIQIEGTKIGGFTDMNGRFAIDKVPATAKYAIFNFLGTKEKRVPISNEMKVSLESDSEVLESVVVTGMQKMDKRLFTGATDKISADDAKLDGIADISRSLEGKSAGVSVQNVSGTFGTAPKIRIRGATSIYGSSKPLWVVDGVIIDDVVDINADELSSGDANTLISSAIAGLNSDDIESFQILKDGSATSIYGARAMADRRIHIQAEAFLQHMQHNEFPRSNGRLSGNAAERLAELRLCLECRHERRIRENVRAHERS